jgi:hypothetical protein
MALVAFQHALCDLIASPALCLAIRLDASEFLSQYDLSPREHLRLQEVVWQRGMSTTCTLYRSNRVTPIYTLLHCTCLILGDKLKSELDAYWSHTELRDLEFRHEIDRFSHFLKQRIAAGLISDPFIEEVLDFELAVNELRFAPRRRILVQLGDHVGSGEGEGVHAHPLVRAIRFTHDAAEVLKALARGIVPYGLPESESFLVLSVTGDELCVKDVEPEAAQILWRVQAGRSYRRSDVQSLLDDGLVCIYNERPPSIPRSRVEASSV